MLNKPALQTLRNHTKFVQDVRYSASGDHFASVGSDGKLFVYDGKDATVVSEVDASKGTIVSPTSCSVVMPADRDFRWPVRGARTRRLCPQPLRMAQ